MSGRSVWLLAAVVSALSTPPIVHAEPGPPAIATGPVGRVALNGPWTLARDPAARGTRRGWHRGGFPGRQVTVPHVVNPAPITGPGGSRSFKGSVAWYRTTITVPRGGTYALRFESINHRASIWLDGQYVGHHVGTYLPFESRLGLEAGREHVLVVRVDWRDPDAMKASGWHRTWFNFGGINREVTLRPIGDSELLAPTVRTRLATGAGGAPTALVDLSVQLRNNGPDRELPVSGTLTHGEQRVPFAFPTRSVASGKSTVLRTQVAVPAAALWSPDAPALYELALAVPGEAAYFARVGLRELTRSGRRVFLNGRPVLLRGASLHEEAPGRGDALTPADQDKLIADLKDIGANATRSQHPLDVGLLERLDAAGIMVWQGIGPVDSPGNWTSRTPALRRQASKRVRVTVRQAQLHPSIIAWNLANEVAGNGHRGGQIGYIDAMARHLHRRDPGRLVAVDVWGLHAPRRPGRLYRRIDAIGVTNYIGWYQDTLAPARRIAAKIRSRLGQLRRAFPRKFVVVSEFGAEANGRNPTHRPGGYRFQARLLALHIDTYRRLGWLGGMLVWNLRDFAVAPSFAGGSIRRQIPGIRLVKGINQKGIISYRGRRKPSAATVRRAFAAMAR